MSDSSFHLETCPIVEAVIDIRCDMSPAFNLSEIEVAAHDAYRDRYREFQKQVLQTHRFEKHGAEPAKISAEEGLQAFQFIGEDGHQLVQIRTNGFSFNRLAPYTGLDGYLPEFERTWNLFVGLTAPALVREVRLRYINRLLLPLVNGQVEFTEYLKVSPRLPDEDRLQFIGFFNQHSAVEVKTGHQVNIIMTMQPEENNQLPMIFDIEVIAYGKVEPNDWSGVRSKVDSLRVLKNRVFQNTLTEKCLNLYSQPDS